MKAKKNKQKETKRIQPKRCQEELGRMEETVCHLVQEEEAPNPKLRRKKRQDQQETMRMQKNWSAKKNKRSLCREENAIEVHASTLLNFLCREKQKQQPATTSNSEHSERKTE